MQAAGAPLGPGTEAQPVQVPIPGPWVSSVALVGEQHLELRQDVAVLGQTQLGTGIDVPEHARGGSQTRQRTQDLLTRPLEAVDLHHDDGRPGHGDSDPLPVVTAQQLLQVRQSQDSPRPVRVASEAADDRVDVPATHGGDTTTLGHTKVVDERRVVDTVQRTVVHGLVPRAWTQPTQPVAKGWPSLVTHDRQPRDRER
jgi:hypothetical protein